MHAQGNQSVQKPIPMSMPMLMLVTQLLRMSMPNNVVYLDVNAPLSVESALPSRSGTRQFLDQDEQRKHCTD